MWRKGSDHFGHVEKSLFQSFYSRGHFSALPETSFWLPASPSIDASFSLCIHTSAPPPARLAWRASALHQRAVYRTRRKDAGEVTKGRACPPSSETREEAAGRRCQQYDMPSRALIRALRAFHACLGILVPLQRLPSLLRALSLLSIQKRPIVLYYRRRNRRQHNRLFVRGTQAATSCLLNDVLSLFDNDAAFSCIVSSPPQG